MDTLLKLETLYNRKEHINALIDIINGSKLKKGPIKKPINYNKPIMIHVIGQESDIESQQSYICTALRQIETVNKLGITNDRIFVICGEGASEENMFCHVHKEDEERHPAEYLNKKLPTNINLKRIPKEGTFDQILTDILSNECTTETPIIFGYDGHGYLIGEGSKFALLFKSQAEKDVVGNMPIHSKYAITDSNITEIFRKTNRLNNNKIFLWTQCGSYDFLKRIIKKNELIGFHIASTNSRNLCGDGSGVMRDFSWKLIKEQFGKRYDKNQLKLPNPPELKELTFEYYIKNTKFYSILLPKHSDKNTKIYKYLDLDLSEIAKRKN